MFSARRVGVLGVIAALALVAGCGDEEGAQENQENQEQVWEGDEIEPRGVAALGGEGFNLVRFSPAPWAEDHFVEASSSEDFEDIVELDLDGAGHVRHLDLDVGEEWFYRVVAESDEGSQVRSSVVSAMPLHNDLISLHVEMDPDDLQTLYERDPHSRDRLDAELRIGAADGPEVEVRGLRFRGATTREYDKKGFNIRLDDRPEIDEYPNFNFRSNDRRTGNRVAINALWTDPSAMREALNFAMYEELELIAPTYYFTELYLNGVFEGLYIGLERVDREAIRRWGLNRSRGEFTMVRDESKSYRHLDEISRRSIFGADIDAVVNSDDEAIELFKEIFRYRGETDDQNWEGVLELVRWVNDTPAGSTFEEEFSERFYVDAFTDFLAIHVLTHDRDVLDVDYWLYRDDADEDAKWKLIPWDKNLTFGHHYFSGFQGVNDFFDYDRDFVNPLHNDLVEKFLATDALRQGFEERLLELATEVFDDAWYEAQMAEISDEIAPAMARMPDEDSYEIHPGQHHGKSGWWKEHKQTLLDFVRLRRAYVFAQIDEEDDAVTRRHRFVDDDGWVIAEFEPDGDDEFEMSVEINELDDEDWRGIDREWTIEVDEHVTGELTLYWRHSPWESWYEELVNPGRQWYLNAYYFDQEEWKSADSEILPFSNKLTVPAEIYGVHQARVGY